MTLLDAFALVAFLRGEPAADEVERLVRRGAVASAVNVAEVVDHVRRLSGLDPDLELDALATAGLEVVPFTDGLARRAGELRSAHYHRVRTPVSLADCAAAATALAGDRPLATADGPLAAVVRREGGAVVPLQDSRGRRP